MAQAPERASMCRVEHLPSSSHPHGAIQRLGHASATAPCQRSPRRPAPNCCSRLQSPDSATSRTRVRRIALSSSPTTRGGRMFANMPTHRCRRCFRDSAATGSGRFRSSRRSRHGLIHVRPARGGVRNGRVRFRSGDGRMRPSLPPRAAIRSARWFYPARPLSPRRRLGTARTRPAASPRRARRLGLSSSSRSDRACRSVLARAVTAVVLLDETAVAPGRNPIERAGEPTFALRPGRTSASRQTRAYCRPVSRTRVDTHHSPTVSHNFKLYLFFKRRSPAGPGRGSIAARRSPARRRDPRRHDLRRQRRRAAASATSPSTATRIAAVGT